MTQPTKTKWATDATWSSGSFTGQVTRLAIPDGVRAQGVKPAKFRAPYFNQLLGEHGDALDSVIDRAAIEWEPTIINTTQPNNDHWDRATFGDSGRLTVGVAPGLLYSNVDGDVLVQFNVVKLFYSLDGRNWVDKGAHGLNVASAYGFAIGQRGDVANTFSIVGWEHTASGAVRQSVNLGTSWAAAGSLPASFEGPVGIGGCFNGRYFICSRSQLYYSDNLANVLWTRITTATLGWNGAPPPDPLCFASSPTECVIGIDGSPSLIWSADGNTWSAAPLPTTPGDGIKHLAWSPTWNLWIAVTGTNNRVLTAPAGFAAWTELAKITDANGAVVTGPRQVATLGRCVVIAAGNGLWVTRNLSTWRRVPDIRLTSDGINLDSWQFLRKFNGRLWAGRTVDASGADRCESTRSGVLPVEFESVGGNW